MASGTINRVSPGPALCLHLWDGLAIRALLYRTWVSHAGRAKVLPSMSLKRVMFSEPTKVVEME